MLASQFNTVLLVDSKARHSFRPEYIWTGMEGDLSGHRSDADFHVSMGVLKP